MPDGTTPWAATGLGLALVLGAGLWWWGSPDARLPRDDGPVIDARIVEAALKSVAPARPTLTDEIEHFQGRLAARGDEGLARDRLLTALLLRYRAYGAHEDLEAAEEQFRARAAAGATSAQFEAARASLHLMRHEFREAVSAARAANELAHGREPHYWLRLFDALWASGRFDEAEPILDLPIDRTSMGVRSRRARVLDRQGEVERARDEFRTVVELSRAYAEPAAVQAWALVELGHFEHHSGDPERAVMRYLDALRILPGSPSALEGLARVAAGVDRDPSTAARLYGHALDQGAHLEAMTAWADVEEEAGNAALAERLRAAFVEAATDNPGAERLYRRPLAFLLAEDPVTVCTALQHARLDLQDRQDPGAWDALAWARYRGGDVAEARRAALLATAGGVPEPETAWRAGLILRVVGERPRSENLLATALDGESELSAGQVAEARRLLAGGQPDPDGPWAPFGRAACDLTPPSRPLPR